MPADWQQLRAHWHVIATFWFDKLSVFDRFCAIEGRGTPDRIVVIGFIICREASITFVATARRLINLVREYCAFRLIDIYRRIFRRAAFVRSEIHTILRIEQNRLTDISQSRCVARVVKINELRIYAREDDVIFISLFGGWILINDSERWIRSDRTKRARQSAK